MLKSAILMMSSLGVSLAFAAPTVPPQLSREIQTAVVVVAVSSNEILEAVKTSTDVQTKQVDDRFERAGLLRDDLAFGSLMIGQALVVANFYTNSTISGLVRVVGGTAGLGSVGSASAIYLTQNVSGLNLGQEILVDSLDQTPAENVIQSQYLVKDSDLDRGLSEASARFDKMFEINNEALVKKVLTQALMAAIGSQGQSFSPVDALLNAGVISSEKHQAAMRIINMKTADSELTFTDHHLALEQTIQIVSVQLNLAKAAQLAGQTEYLQRQKAKLERLMTQLEAIAE